jgi:7-keto-8-aminopelargonate synthetase-like enzyme
MVIESVYSMDGDIGNLPEARRLCDKYNLLLICDEAHGLGTIGATGRGLEEHFNMPGACDVVCGTFSKSLASVGGYISGKDEMIQYMEFFA